MARARSACCRAAPAELQVTIALPHGRAWAATAQNASTDLGLAAPVQFRRQHSGAVPGNAAQRKKPLGA
eukprot:9928944-Alexandrium_andersonii.AAC.1